MDYTLDVESLIETALFQQTMYPEFGLIYAAAGSLTRFLVDRHGRDAYLGFFKTVPLNASGPEIREAFQTAVAGAGGPPGR